MAAWGLPPHDRHFLHAEPLFLGQVQNFDVETKPVQPLHLKQAPRRFLLKTLKAALRVRKTSQHDCPDQSVKNPAGEPTLEALLNVAALVRESPRTDRDGVTLIQSFSQFVYFLDRGRQSRVRDQKVFAACRQDASADRETLAMIFVVRNKPKPSARMIFDEVVHKIHCLIA